jgi:hypothetical protein
MPMQSIHRLAHLAKRSDDGGVEWACPQSKNGERAGARTARRVAWGLWSVATAVIAVGMILVVLTRSVSDPSYANWYLWLLFMLGYLSFPTVGLLIAVRQPTNPLGWLLLGIGLTLGLNDAMHAYADYTLVYKPGALPAGLPVGWVSTWNWAFIFPLLPFLFLLFPDGRLPSRRWRPLAWAAGLLGSLVVLLSPFRPGPLEYFPKIRNPTGIPALPQTALPDLSLTYSVVLLVATASLLLRFRRARGDERQQLKWVAFVAVVFGAVAIFGSRWLPLFLSSLLSAVTLAGFAAAIGVAILRYRLYDIDWILHRTLVYGLLTAILGLGYAGAVVVFGQVLGEHRSSLAVAAATLAMAALFRPARRRIQRAVDRRFNRRRYDAAAMVERFSVRLREQIDLDTLTGELLAVVDQTMEPTQASLWLRHTAIPQ